MACSNSRDRSQNYMRWENINPMCITSDQLKYDLTIGNKKALSLINTYYSNTMMFE